MKHEKKLGLSGPVEVTPFRHKLALGRAIDIVPTTKRGRYITPKRPPDESTKLCSKHHRRQSRNVQVIGPITELQILKIITEEVKNGLRMEIFPRSPLRSHKMVWKMWPFCYFVPPIPGLWYVTFVTTKCPDCTQPLEEKAYRRLQGLLGLWTLQFEIFVRSPAPFLFQDTYRLVPYDPTKTLRQHLKV